MDVCLFETALHPALRNNGCPTFHSGTFRLLPVTLPKRSVSAVTMSPVPSAAQQCTNRVPVQVPRQNRRSAVRYRLSAKVVISWSGDDGLLHEFTGRTRDLSPGGAYVFSSIFPPLRQLVRMSIHLPMSDGEACVPCVDVQGHVYRIDSIPTAAECGFSVCNEKVTLCAL
jgi:hypothetical protein